MAHYAKIENDIVTQVIRIPDEHEGDGQSFINNKLGIEGEWIQTSYNHKIRKRFAGIGDTYLREHDVFVRPQPYPSWELDDDFVWQPPSSNPYPQTDQPNIYYTWIEETQTWKEHIEEIETITSGSENE